MQAPAAQTPSRLGARLKDPMTVAVAALGVTQITGWGTSFYALGVLAGPVTADTGWSRSLVFFGFTIALLVMSVVSAYVGRAIDRHGARLVMGLGTVVVSAGQLALSVVQTEVQYLAAWALTGLGMRCCLYDAAFAALVQVTPSRGRKAISYLTLPGAFASSVFWVVGHFLNDAVGWRQTFVLFAIINLVVCLPLHWFGLARRDEAPAATAGSAAAAQDAEAALTGRARKIGIVVFALIMALNGFVFGVVSVQLVPILEAAGLATAAAVWMASLKGVAQFSGRVVEIAFGRNLHAMNIARIAIGALLVSLGLLLFSSGSFAMALAFTLMMGGAQGVITIVRGAVPLALFGTKGYGEVLGLIATPNLLVNAFAPTIFALMIDGFGWRSAEMVLVVCSALAFVGIELMARWYRTARGPT